ncbi:hypothetical protein [Aquisphaera insulae]|uniref:hypothetical protein n=1 Tax=Aquisphaera insulae TaxID=2712864 RepID=UPI0013EA40C2|nr:hypothetical protein [Aquisphaera insulae]
MRRTITLAAVVLGLVCLAAASRGLAGRPAQAAPESWAGFIHAEGEPWFINPSNIAYVQTLTEGPEKAPHVEIHFVGTEKPLRLQGASAKAMLDSITRH